MNNCEEFQCPELHLGLRHVKDALRCILHTIVFTRSVGSSNVCIPVEMHSDQLDLFYVKVRDSTLDAIVEAKIRSFAGMFERGLTTRAQLSLSFYELRTNTRMWGIFRHPDEKMFFETWRVPLRVHIPPTRSAIPPTSSSSSTSVGFSSSSSSSSSFSSSPYYHPNSNGAGGGGGGYNSPRTTSSVAYPPPPLPPPSSLHSFPSYRFSTGVNEEANFAERDVSPPRAISPVPHIQRENSSPTRQHLGPLENSPFFSSLSIPERSAVSSFTNDSPTSSAAASPPLSYASPSSSFSSYISPPQSSSEILPSHSSPYRAHYPPPSPESSFSFPIPTTTPRMMASRSISPLLASTSSCSSVSNFNTSFSLPHSPDRHHLPPPDRLVASRATQPPRCLQYSSTNSIRRLSSSAFYQSLSEEHALQNRACGDVRKALLFVLQKINEKPNHLPPPPHNYSAYRFKISFEGPGHDTGWHLPAALRNTTVRNIPYLTS